MVIFEEEWWLFWKRLADVFEVGVVLISIENGLYVFWHDMNVSLNLGGSVVTEAFQGMLMG